MRVPSGDHAGSMSWLGPPARQALPAAVCAHHPHVGRPAARAGLPGDAAPVRRPRGLLVDEPAAGRQAPQLAGRRVRDVDLAIPVARAREREMAPVGRDHGVAVAGEEPGKLRARGTVGLHGRPSEGARRDDRRARPLREGGVAALGRQRYEHEGRGDEPEQEARETWSRHAHTLPERVRARRTAVVVGFRR